MVAKQLAPRLELLSEEYVLIQAWKKTSAFIRYHNWYSDTLALDRAAVNLPEFLGELRERLRSWNSWTNDPLRIVPAPKSQRWRVQEGVWEPEEGVRSARLRPLAHVGLAEQVVATALMLCLADRIETLQGDPRLSVDDMDSRKRVVSYGNRLFCDAINGELRHRWGSAKLYRAYYQDYRTFLSRPEVVSESAPEMGGKKMYVVHADLKQFYDRVHPKLLSEATNRIRHPGDDPRFFDIMATVLNWRWDSRDNKVVQMYANQAQLEDFTQVTLPQGLVASGFFANAVLGLFDDSLRAVIGTEIMSGILLVDVCRYVDDLRLVVAAEPGPQRMLKELEKPVSEWLGRVLKENANGLELSPEKTRVAALGGEERPLVLQSAKMNRIQSAVSGGFDALGGEEILDAIQGLLRAQKALRVADDGGWRLSPVPDVRDATVARFGAARYRITYRSIRPLLQDEDLLDGPDLDGDELLPDTRLRKTRTRRELDRDARVFALGLIQRWIDDPSNVRLLRIGLDLWPDDELLREVLALLRPFTEKGGRRKEPRRVAWYCLAEILRAGATETGLVADTESLPSELNLEAYRKELRSEAARLVTLPARTIPWYLRQQALLFLAACDPAAAPRVHTGRGKEMRHYREMIRFLRGEAYRLRSSDFATLAVLARRSFMDRARALELTRHGLTPSRMRQLARRDPTFLLELVNAETDSALDNDLPARVREDLCLVSGDSDSDTLAAVVLNKYPHGFGPLRNELSLLYFAKAFLDQWREQELPLRVITPEQVGLELGEGGEISTVKDLRILGSLVDHSGSLYDPPSWCKDTELWRVQLGFLLRFILSRQPDFTRPVSPESWIETESSYRPAESHWYQRLHGLYSGQPAFGDDWLPITDWFEGFLLALLHWPGCRAPREFKWVEQGIEATKLQIERRIKILDDYRGVASRTLILPLPAKPPTASNDRRSLRVCVVQTVIPSAAHFKEQCPDLALDKSAIRQEHRRHLSAALASVKRMLVLRETHKGSDGGLDWLILPELAVHPKDVRTHLIPFARAHKAMILTGMTYEAILAGQPLVNSALWVIPEWPNGRELQIRIRRQGKKHLAQEEQAFNSDGDVVQGFRPCQWLIGYPWSREVSAASLWLTAAVCYDATDLRLAADLRDVSDVLAIPSLNKDVKTFDQMAKALHYHMYQIVVVANNGTYGGSNAYWPKSKSYVRKIFHTHGQPQATISFLDIDDIGVFLKRKGVSRGNASTGNKTGKGDDLTGRGTNDWKYPPAGITPSSRRGKS